MGENLQCPCCEGVAFEPYQVWSDDDQQMVLGYQDLDEPLCGCPVRVVIDDEHGASVSWDEEAPCLNCDMQAIREHMRSMSELALSCHRKLDALRTGAGLIFISLLHLRAAHWAYGLLLFLFFSLVIWWPDIALWVGRKMGRRRVDSTKPAGIST